MTFNSQVEATKKAHAMLVSTYKEMQQKKAERKKAYDELIHSDISTICRNLRDLEDAFTKNFEHEQATRDEAINKLKREMIILMEITFEADFVQRIPVALCLVQEELLQSKTSWTSLPQALTIA